ncbi:hypothetical protein WHR41_08892 [Cladosporium halotolerans]|uniref:Quinate transporter n=1 Tax=Cladosporium halotolerans TaxID=1052096 RepID=A0AB34KBS5_9PEZI
MGVLAKVEDRPTPPAVYNWRVYVSAMVASFASCMIGYTTSFIGTTVALDSFGNEFGFDEMSTAESTLIKANVVSLFQAGAFFGSPLAYTTCHYIGRVKSLWITASIFIVGAAITFASINGELGPLYASRIICGLGVGGCTMVVPIYIAEMAPPAIRGRLVGTYELGWQIGGLVGFWINYGMINTLPGSRNQWLIPFAIQLVPAGMLLIGSLMLKETPRWLFTKGRYDEGIKNLCWIRKLEADHTYILEEIAMMEQQIQDLPRGFFSPIKDALEDSKTRWRLFLGHSLFILQNFAGVNAINYYSPDIFRSVGIRSQDTIYLTTGLFGVVKTVITVFWLTVLIDKWGRRQLLIFGAIGGSVTMFIIGALVTTRVHSDTPTTMSLSSSGIATVFMVYLWTAIYVNSWNGTPWVINAEMFSQRTRNIGQLFASMANWLWTFIIARITPNMIDGMGESGYGMYFLFGAVTLCGLAFVWFFIPETKSVPLDKMDRLFEIRPTSKAHRTVMEEAQNESFDHDEIVAKLEKPDHVA